MSLPRRLVLGLLLALAGLAFVASSASAHAGLESSDPPGGATLQRAPAQVVMNFTEEPDVSLCIVHVLNTAGANVEAGPARIGANAKQLVVPLPPDLGTGSYTVSWRVVSAEDGHVTAAAFAFGVGTAPLPPSATASAPTTPRPSVLGVVGKMLLYAGLALVVGAAATALFAFGGHVPDGRRLLQVSAVMTLAGGLTVLAAERATVGVPLSTLLRAPAGRPFIWLAVGAAVTALAAVLAARLPSRSALMAAGLAGAITMLARVGGGHAASAAVAWFQIGSQWIHFVAAGIWVGGFVPVLLLLRERRAAGDAIPAREVRRYSSMAGVALLLVAISGTVRATNELGGPGAFLRILRTSYGTVLLLKLGLAGALIALGAWNRYRSIPGLGTKGGGMLRRVMRFEVLTAVGVFALTGTLTGLVPNPPVARVATAPASISATASDFATTMKVTLTATPGTAGPNTFEVGVRDYDTGAPLDVTGVSLTFSLSGRADVAASTIDLTRDTSSTWTADGTNLSIAGTWRVTVLVQQGARATTIPLALTTIAPPQQVSVSSPEPGLPTIYTITLTGGEQIQTYNDPGTAGPNQLHVTAFGPGGNELPLASIVITATPAGGSPRTLDTKRFSAGHFVASPDLQAGAWHFDLVATARDGSTLQASFDQTIG